MTKKEFTELLEKYGIMWDEISDTTLTLGLDSDLAVSFYGAGDNAFVSIQSVQTRGPALVVNISHSAFVAYEIGEHDGPEGIIVSGDVDDDGAPYDGVAVAMFFNAQLKKPEE